MSGADESLPTRRVMSPAAGLSHARALHQQGRLEAAARLYRAVLELDGASAAALRGLGMVACGLGRAEEGLAWLRRAAALSPDAATLNDLGLALEGAGRPDEAGAAYAQALERDPDCLEAHNNLANLLRLSGAPAAALPHLQAAVRLRPDAAAVQANLGLTLLDLGRAEAALAAFEAALAAAPRAPEAWRGRGQALVALEREADAEAAFAEALSIDPGDAYAHAHLGRLQGRRGDHAAAAASLRRAVAARPDLAEAQANLGNALAALGRDGEAEAAFAAALALRPDFAEALCGLGAALMARGAAADAARRFRAALALSPDLPEAAHGLGNALQALGNLEESRAFYERAVALAPERGDFHRGLAEAKRFTPGDPQLAVMQALAATPGLEDAQRMPLLFALGKAYADLGRHPEALEALIEGNALKRAAVDYNEAATLAMFRRVEAVFDAALFERLGGLGDPTAAPVFIVGMPRSGTTLVEQILASHPQVFGAGELNHMHELARALRWPDGRFAFPDLVPSLTGPVLAELGRREADRLQVLAPGAARIVDKMPENFLLVGLIRLIFPGARFIRLARDPVDVCVSCFSKLFGANQPHTYDLAELGRYSQAFERLMQHWRAVLPPEAWLEVRYEDLVADLEGEGRRIVAHLGLAWDDRCLDFHRTRRVVRTASAVQVRQPIYNSSIGRGRLYGDRLKPLLEALQSPPWTT